jgi:aldose 1-epimerase
VGTIELDNGILRLRFVPEVGGSLTDWSARLAGEWVPILRRAREPLARSSAGASFTLAPWSNRLRDGRFRFQGRIHQLRGAEKHAIHGDVRDRPWRLTRHEPTEALLEFRSRDVPDPNFPFPFDARVRYVLDGRMLVTGLELSNAGTEPMPAGGGFHPYFNRALGGRDENVELRFDVSGVYPAGDPPLPTGPPVALPPAQDFSRRRPLDVALDHCFSGWDGAAELYWPASDVSVRMQANEALSHLILYSPPGEPFFALEPVANANDGFNLAAAGQPGTGVVVLEPGRSLALEFRLILEGGSTR